MLEFTGVMGEYKENKVVLVRGGYWDRDKDAMGLLCVVQHTFFINLIHVPHSLVLLCGRKFLIEGF